MHSKNAKRRRLTVLTVMAIPLVVSVVLSGCATEQQASGGSKSTVSLKTRLTEAAKAEAKKVSGGKKFSGSISVIGDNSGTEGAIIEAFYKPFTDATGLKINYTGSNDHLNIVQAQVAAGDPPDVVTTAPGIMADYLKTNKLLNLSSFMGDELKQNFTSSTLDTASVNGSVYGVYQGFNNFEYWYNPQKYTGPKAGSTWQDVEDWTNANAAKGTPTWCNGQEAGATSGYPGFGFLQELFAKQWGPKLTKEWADGQLPWTSPQVKATYQKWGNLVGKDANVAGGVAGSLSQDSGTMANGLVTDPPGCQAVVWGSWTGGSITSSAKGVKPGVNLDLMPVPPVKPQWSKTETYSATATYAFKDTPAIRAFMEYIASTQAQTLLASANQWPVSNINVPTSTYSDPLLRKIAKYYFSDQAQLTVDVTNLASAAVIQQAYKSIVGYLQDPSSLDQQLQDVQQVQDGNS